MLKSLFIQNIATAQNLTVVFGPGLNVLTGSTGAGKSVVVNALALLTGKPFGGNPNGAPAAVEAVFSFEQHDLSEQRQNAHVRREFFQKKSRCYLNGKPTSQKKLFGFCQSLIDFTSQFENQQLFKLTYQRDSFDQFAQTLDMSHDYQVLMHQAQTLLKERSQLLEHWQKWDHEKAQVEEIVDYIGALQPSPVEFEKLSAQFKRAQKAQKFLTQLEFVDAHCKALEDVLNHLKKSVYNLSKNLPTDSPLMGQVDGFLENLFSNQSLLQSAIEEEQHFYQCPSEDFHLTQERWDAYNRLLRRFGPTVEDALNTLDRKQDQIKNSRLVWEALENSKKVFKKTLEQLIEMATHLTQKRRHKATDLQCKIESALRDLGMPHARFEIKMLSQLNASLLDGPLAHSLGPLLEDAWKTLGPVGYETPQYWFSANPGMAPCPLEHVASGGELSRIMLALKALNMDSKNPSVFVFDEIDSGISGAMASQVGKKLSDFCKHHQAICITHLPQVACHAHTHLVVTKHIRKGISQTLVQNAQGQEHIEAVAKLLSGSSVSPESMAQAQVLVREATHA